VPRLESVRKCDAIFSISRIAPQKGLEYLLDAFDRVSKIRDRTELWLAGTVSGQFREYGEFIFRKAEKMENVVWLGRLSEEEKWIRMNSACLFAMPSVYEPFGLNALEAMSIGVPVVSYVTDGTQFMLSKGGGIVVRKRNAKSLARTIMFLLENKERMSEMGMRGKKIFETAFSNDKFMDRILSVYECNRAQIP
jgi:glycosyltransferase involved in cell wall biosynthesis